MLTLLTDILAFPQLRLSCSLACATKRQADLLAVSTGLITASLKVCLAPYNWSKSVTIQ